MNLFPNKHKKVYFKLFGSYTRNKKKISYVFILTYIFMRSLKSHPLFKLLNSYLIDSPQPSNLNYLWNFGSLLALCLGIQIVTGVTLAMHYNPSITEAFNSVEHIMRDVNNGWLIRYLHSNTASAFFFLVYLHIGRGMYYGSYKAPRTLVWVVGTIIFILMIVTAFLGYVYSPKWFIYITINVFNLFNNNPINNLSNVNKFLDNSDSTPLEGMLSDIQLTSVTCLSLIFILCIQLIFKFYMKESITLNLSKYLGDNLNKSLETYINKIIYLNKKVSIFYVWFIILLLIIGFCTIYYLSYELYNNLDKYIKVHNYLKKK